MASEIIFHNKIPKTFVFHETFKQIFSLILKNEDITKKSIVNCVFLSKNKMLEYNQRYRNIEKISDVLSFTNDYETQYKYLKKFDIGDIVFCHTKISGQAKEYNHTLKREYCYLFTHSLLHLFGYDHQTEEEAKKMNEIVNKIMEKLNIER